MAQAKSEEAQRFLDSELVRRFFSDTESAMIERWKATREDQDEIRERIFLCIKLLESFKLYINDAIDDGKMAAHQLEVMLTGQLDRD